MQSSPGESCMRNQTQQEKGTFQRLKIYKHDSAQQLLKKGSVNSHICPSTPFKKRWSPVPANYKLFRGPCWSIKIVSNFSIKQLYVLYKPAASGRARNKLVHICQKKSKNISFPKYSKFHFLYGDSRGARDLVQAQTYAMNSQICFFWWMRINAPKR